MKIVIINGAASVGKDLFVKQCKDLIGDFRCFNYSTVDFVKYVAVCAGWKGHKTPEDRAFLSDLKKLLAQWHDLPYEKTKREIRDCCALAAKYDTLDESVIFIHCREPQEIERFVEEFGATTLLVERKTAECPEPSNDSDKNVYDFTYDCIVENSGTVDDLKDSARTYLTEVLGFTI